jgi:glycosyltransferase involved in cell wall biosynthesis
MAYAPNEDGLLYFYNEILPLIHQSIPHVKLYIVGKSPSDAVKNLASNTVIVTGKVDDLRDYYARAQVAICPIRYGAGTLNKVIEPMAMAIPVVSTSIACVGMNVKPIENFEQNTEPGIQEYKDENIVFADTPETFAQAVVTLLQKPNLCKQIGITARKLVEKEHDWEQIVAKLEQIYQSISKSEGFEQLTENTLST